MHRFVRKAALTVCLFLCVVCLAVSSAGHGNVLPVTPDQQWRFSARAQQAYDLIFDLDFRGVHQLLPAPKSTDEAYVIALAEAVELLLEEDSKKYTVYEEHFLANRERKAKHGSPEDVYFHAELAIQWAFIYFKFGHEFDAALSLRDAYNTTAQGRERYPRYDALKKTAAMLEVIVGSVPEKYNWVLSLLGFEGSVSKGLSLFDEVHESSSPLRQESDILHAMVRCYVLQQTSEASALFEPLLHNHPSSLVSFVASAVAIKNAENEKALRLLLPLDTLTSLRVDYASYLLGEVYLCKAEYANSITSYRKFLRHYKGQHNIKDAYYKIGLCYWLNHDINDATAAFEVARNSGREVTEADKYAARSLAEEEYPHIALTQARYLTDGGYYDEALRLLGSIASSELVTTRDRIEFHYRFARLEHKMYKLESAKQNYLKVIELNGKENWYYAPNSCLQMGYILAYEMDYGQAEEYFEMALSYKKHEYKNSIDTKARSALAQLKRK